MSIASTSPACCLPGAIHRPGLAAWKVTVEMAFTARPPTSPLDASTPLGTSHAHDRRRQRGDRFDRLRHGATRGAREARAEQSIDDHSGACKSGGDIGAAKPLRRRPWQARQVSLRVRAHLLSLGDCDHAHVASPLAQQPREHQPVATVVALAAEHSRRDHRDRCAPRQPRPPCPARSISCSDGTPCSSIAQRSTARICCASGRAVHQSGSLSIRGDASDGTPAAAVAPSLLDGHRLGEVAGLVDVQATLARDVVGEQSAAVHRQQRLQHPVQRRHRDRNIRWQSISWLPSVPARDHCAPRARTSCDVGQQLLEHRRVGRHAHHRGAGPAARSGRASSPRRRRRQWLCRRSP